jgi:protein-tyrosine phosphatase
MRKISEYSLWLGHAGDIRGGQRPTQAGISAVVDLAVEEPPTTLTRELAYCRFPLVDGSGNLHWMLRSAVLTVAGLLRSGTPTLVCCGAGMSRAPAIAGAAIAVVRGCSPDEGLRLIMASGAADVSPALWSEIRAALA